MDAYVAICLPLEGKLAEMPGMDEMYSDPCMEEFVVAVLLLWSRKVTICEISSQWLQIPIVLYSVGQVQFPLGHVAGGNPPGAYIPASIAFSNNVRVLVKPG